MAFKSDIEIAQEAVLQPINAIAASLGIPEDAVENYGRYKAKLDLHALKDLPEKGKLILVTAITPTPAGEGKTTTSVGLTDGLRKLGKNAVQPLDNKPGYTVTWLARRLIHRQKFIIKQLPRRNCR